MVSQLCDGHHLPPWIIYRGRAQGQCCAFWECFSLVGCIQPWQLHLPMHVVKLVGGGKMQQLATLAWSALSIAEMLHLVVLRPPASKTCFLSPSILSLTICLTLSLRILNQFDLWRTGTGNRHHLFCYQTSVLKKKKQQLAKYRAQLFIYFCNWLLTSPLLRSYFVLLLWVWSSARWELSTGLCHCMLVT